MARSIAADSLTQYIGSANLIRGECSYSANKLIVFTCSPLERDLAFVGTRDHCSGHNVMFPQNNIDNLAEGSFSAVSKKSC